MNEIINLKEIEKRSHRAYFQTGIYDIAFGALILSFAIAPVIREVIGRFYIPFVIIPASLIILLGMKYLIVPRLGIVKFGEKRKSAKKKMMIITIISTTILTVLLALTVAGVFPGFIGEVLSGVMFMLIIGIIVIILMGFIAYIMDFKNIFYYGLAIGIGIPTAELLYGVVGAPLDSLITFGTLGSLLLIYGIVNLSCFLKKYPIPKEEMSNEKSG
jgi:hypothetical protein